MDALSECDMIQNKCESEFYVRTSNWFSSLVDRASLDRAIKPLGKQRHAAVDQPQKESLCCMTILDECCTEQFCAIQQSKVQRSTA